MPSLLHPLRFAAVAMDEVDVNASHESLLMQRTGTARARLFASSCRPYKASASGFNLGHHALAIAFEFASMKKMNSKRNSVLVVSTV